MGLKFDTRIKALQARGRSVNLAGGRRGIEKESLRVTPKGQLAATGHFAALGSALTNRYITTDYSEALLEFVTPPEDSPWSALQYLCDIHQFVYESIDDEILWAFSMPCGLPEQGKIPLARYGDSNIGRMKTIYRRGLGFRYGRYMQVISGLHFNYSMSEELWPVLMEIDGASGEAGQFKSESYFGLVRNVRRLDWILLYLFGASPTVCKSFTEGKKVDLDEFDQDTLYGQYATSLRMSDLGYQNKNQAAVRVSANSLAEYVSDLSKAVHTPNPEYIEIGIERDGVRRQLNANQLQIENEYYSTIRPKRVARSGERPTAALLRAGVEYVELRALDISPFDPVGINQTQIRFLEAFLIYCLLLDSPPIDAEGQRDNQSNHSIAATRGREPGLALTRDRKQVDLRQWAMDICDQMMPVCELLDSDTEGGYVDTLRTQMAVVQEPDRTPSARLIAELRETGMSYIEYAMHISQCYRDYFLDLAPEHLVHRSLLEAEVPASLESQRAIEEADDTPFEDFVSGYLG